MFKVTVDIFSGRHNPEWIVDDNDGQNLLREFSENRDLITEGRSSSGYNGLGFRGINIDLMEDAAHFGLPQSFSIGDSALSLNIARRMVDQMLNYRDYELESHIMTPINRDVQQFILTNIDSFESDILPNISLFIKGKRKNDILENDIITTKNDPENCAYEIGAYNPQFWEPSKLHNNCYNYAANRLTNTYATPGKWGNPNILSLITRINVIQALAADQVKAAGDCIYNNNDAPRWLIALVVNPGWDFHFYRKHAKFWAHKPGQTSVTSTDDKQKTIKDPKNCSRKSYPDFCGYFYVGKNVKIK